jgi:hypothetical protein
VVGDHQGGVVSEGGNETGESEGGGDVRRERTAVALKACDRRPGGVKASAAVVRKMYY